MYYDAFDLHPDDEGFDPGSAYEALEGYGFDSVPPAPLELDDGSLVLDESSLVLIDEIHAALDPLEGFRNLRIGMPGGRAWKVKIDWPRVRKLGATYGPIAAAGAAMAVGVPVPVAAVVGQVVGQTLRAEEKQPPQVPSAPDARIPTSHESPP